MCHALQNRRAHLQWRGPAGRQRRTPGLHGGTHGQKPEGLRPFPQLATEPAGMLHENARSQSRPTCILVQPLALQHFSIGCVRLRLPRRVACSHGGHAMNGRELSSSMTAQMWPWAATSPRRASNHAPEGTVGQTTPACRLTLLQLQQQAQQAFVASQVQRRCRQGREKCRQHSSQLRLSSDGRARSLSCCDCVPCKPKLLHHVPAKWASPAATRWRSAESQRLHGRSIQSAEQC